MTFENKNIYSIRKFKNGSDSVRIKMLLSALMLTGVTTFVTDTVNAQETGASTTTISRINVDGTDKEPTSVTVETQGDKQYLKIMLPDHVQYESGDYISLTLEKYNTHDPFNDDTIKLDNTIIGEIRVKNGAPYNKEIDNLSTFTKDKLLEKIDDYVNFVKNSNKEFRLILNNVDSLNSKDINRVLYLPLSKDTVQINNKIDIFTHNGEKIVIDNTIKEEVYNRVNSIESFDANVKYKNRTIHTNPVVFEVQRRDSHIPYFDLSINPTSEVATYD